MAGLFYVDRLPDTGAAIRLSGDDGFHAAVVRRIRPGERLTLGDGVGTLADCEVDAADRTGLQVRVLHRRQIGPPARRVTVVQAVPKAERAELAIELATEAGADGFVAWQAQRCVARWDGARADNGLRRWRAVSRAAAAQSRRAHLPEVAGVLSTAALTEWTGRQAAAGATVLVLHASADTRLADAVPAGVRSLALVVGPEGGITDSEFAALTAAGAVAVRLGPTVLRTSTAAVVALGALGVLTGGWH